MATRLGSPRAGGSARSATGRLGRPPPGSLGPPSSSTRSTIAGRGGRPRPGQARPRPHRRSWKRRLVTGRSELRIQGDDGVGGTTVSGPSQRCRSWADGHRGRADGSPAEPAARAVSSSQPHGGGPGRSAARAAGSANRRRAIDGQSTATARPGGSDPGHRAVRRSVPGSDRLAPRSAASQFGRRGRLVPATGEADQDQWLGDAPAQSSGSRPGLDRSPTV